RSLRCRLASSRDHQPYGDPGATRTTLPQTRLRRQTMTQDQADVVTKLSPHPVADTVSKLTGMISAKGIRLFAVIDQSAEARQAGLSLRETTLVIFGSPAAGTPVMAAAPLAALGHQPGLGQRGAVLVQRQIVMRKRQLRPALPLRDLDHHGKATTVIY